MSKKNIKTTTREIHESGIEDKTVKIPSSIRAKIEELKPIIKEYLEKYSEKSKNRNNKNIYYLKESKRFIYKKLIESVKKKIILSTFYENISKNYKKCLQNSLNSKKWMLILKYIIRKIEKKQ